MTIEDKCITAMLLNNLGNFAEFAEFQKKKWVIFETLLKIL